MRIVYRLLHLSNLLVLLTGSVYGSMKYFMKPASEFDVVNHSWQPHVLHAHVVTAPFLTMVIGSMLIHHAWVYFTTGMREGKYSGLAMAGLALPMIFSGYFIQVSMNDAWRLAWIILHIITSTLWTLNYVGHWFFHKKARRNALIKT